MEFTDWGLWLERQAQTGERIEITDIQIGNQPWSGGNPQAAEQCLNPIVTVPVDAVYDMREEFGHVIVRIREDQLIQAFDDAGVTSFLYAERAIRARDPVSGTPKALCYVNAGELAETVHLYNHPEIARLELEFHLEIARAAEVVVNIGTDPAYVTPSMLAQDIAKHDADPDAHAEKFAAVDGEISAVNGRVNQTNLEVTQVQGGLNNHINRTDNPHQVNLAQLLGVAGVIPIANGGTGSPYTQAYYASGQIQDTFGPFPWYVYCYIQGYLMTCFGRISGIGSLAGGGSASRATIPLPVPFADNTYFANASMFDEVTGFSATISNKATNSIEIHTLGTGSNADVDFMCVGLAANISSILNRPGSAGFYPPI